jgi:hypothetical protein
MSNNRSHAMRIILPVAFLASLALAVTLRAAPPTPVENPSASPAPVPIPHSLKHPVPVETLSDSVVTRRKGFEVVPGKDPNGWSFILEPYLWALGVDGTVGVKGFDTQVEERPGYKVAQSGLFMGVGLKF